MKRAVILILAVGLLLCACVPGGKPKQYSQTYLDLFDTVTTIVGTGQTEEAFRESAQKIYEDLLRYHRLFDIYNTYAGINNLKTVNEQASVAPVVVDEAIIALLRDCKAYYEHTGGKVNAAMGGVLKLWHEARTAGLAEPETARLPDMEKLRQAATHASFDAVVIDEAASTVFITDPQVSLDVGAIAKGWATQKAAQAAPQGLLVSVGGNVCATGPKDENGTPWVIGVQDPQNSGAYLHTIQVHSGAVVTSGDYQRTYEVDGVQYHHIIDPETCMPATYWRSVTVVCADSAVADALSTALFLLPLEEGQRLAAQWEAQALWVDSAGKESMTDGFRTLIKQ